MKSRKINKYNNKKLTYFIDQNKIMSKHRKNMVLENISPTET